MLNRPVIAYDGSEESYAAFRFARKLIDPGDRLTLAHVVELPHPHAADTPEAGQALRWGVERSVEDWRERLASLAADVPDAAAVDTEVLTERRAAPALLDLVAERDADLLVAGTRGVGGLKRALLGSVSHQLLDHAPCSVLLVRARPQGEAAPVVVAAIDGSAATAGIVAVAAQAARILSASLVLAHVVDERLASAGWSVEATTALRDWAREQGRRVLEDAGQSVEVAFERELLEGNPPRELVALCERRQPLLAVAGSRGLHGFKGLLVGSTARYLVNQAPCPVLVARG